MSDMHMWFERYGPLLLNMSSHWMVIRSAQQLGEEALAARKVLAERYYRPIYHTLLTWGLNREDALDATHQFLADFCEGRYIESADAERGKFRHYLAACLRNMLRKEWRTQERHPQRALTKDDEDGVVAVTTDELDREMAWETYREALKQTEMVLGSDCLTWRLFYEYDVEPQGHVPRTPAEWADRYGVDVRKIEREVLKARRTFETIVCRLLADTVGTEKQLDEEIKWFIRCIAAGPPPPKGGE